MTNAEYQSAANSLVSNAIRLQTEARKRGDESIADACALVVWNCVERFLEEEKESR